MDAASPLVFGASLVVLGIVMFSIPDGAVAPLATIIILGTLLAANRDASARGVKGPLEELLK